MPLSLATILVLADVGDPHARELIHVWRDRQKGVWEFSWSEGQIRARYTYTDPGPRWY